MIRTLLDTAYIELRATSESDQVREGVGHA